MSRTRGLFSGALLISLVVMVVVWGVISWQRARPDVAKTPQAETAGSVMQGRSRGDGLADRREHAGADEGNAGAAGAAQAIDDGGLASSSAGERRDSGTVSRLVPRLPEMNLPGRQLATGLGGNAFPPIEGVPNPMVAAGITEEEAQVLMGLWIEGQERLAALDRSEQEGDISLEDHERQAVELIEEMNRRILEVLGPERLDRWEQALQRYFRAAFEQGLLGEARGR